MYAWDVVLVIPNQIDMLMKPAVVCHEQVEEAVGWVSTHSKEAVGRMWEKVAGGTTKANEGG